MAETTLDGELLESARETIRRLNRRLGVAESALAEKLDEAKGSGGSLGRALTGWAYTREAELLDALEASNEVAVTLPDGRLASLSYQVTVTRAKDTIGPIGAMPTLREIADAIVRIRRLAGNAGEVPAREATESVPVPTPEQRAPADGGTT